MNEVELIQSLIDDINELPHRDEEKLDYLRRRTVMIIGKVFGDSDVAKQYKEDISKIEFNARPKYKRVVKERHTGLDPSQPIELKGNVITPPTEQEKDNTWILGKIEMLKILKIMLEESKLEEIKMQQDPQQNRVFVVHGHDGEMKEAVARTLEKLGLESIILHELPDKGRTIIEKFEYYSKVDFAVVLLSPDDVGCLKSKLSDEAKPRVRQNVIFELGYFVGRLGRDHVHLLCRDDEIEFPSDYYGVLYTPYDASGGWKFKLAKELKACGYNIDLNKLVSN